MFHINYINFLRQPLIFTNFPFIAVLDNLGRIRTIQTTTKGFISFCKGSLFLFIIANRTYETITFSVEPTVQYFSHLR